MPLAKATVCGLCGQPFAAVKLDAPEVCHSLAVSIFDIHGRLEPREAARESKVVERRTRDLASASDQLLRRSPGRDPIRRCREASVGAMSATVGSENTACHSDA